MSLLKRGRQSSHSRGKTAGSLCSEQLLCLRLQQAAEALCVLVVRPSVRPLTSILRDAISLYLSMKLGTDIHRVSANCWKSF